MVCQIAHQVGLRVHHSSLHHCIFLSNRLALLGPLANSRLKTWEISLLLGSAMPQNRLPHAFSYAHVHCLLLAHARNSYYTCTIVTMMDSVLANLNHCRGSILHFSTEWLEFSKQYSCLHWCNNSHVNLTLFFNANFLSRGSLIN